MHQVHHSDPEFDVSTAIRFHPIEIVLSMLFKVGLVYLLGPSALAVLVFEILLNASACLITPISKSRQNLKSFSDYSSLHQTCTGYTTPQIEANTILTTGSHSLFGINYLAPHKVEPNLSHQEMEVGLKWQNDKPTKFWWSIWLPFRNK